MVGVLMVGFAISVAARMGASLARLGCGSDVSLAFPCLHSRRAYTCRDEEYRPVFGVLVRVAAAGVTSEFIGITVPLQYRLGFQI